MPGAEENIVLVWICLGCGWRHAVPTPGFAGDGYYHWGKTEHYDQGGCGPLIAIRAPDFLRARPGEDLDQEAICDG
jgi:hypothetical protein